jgi:hypothetical protein
MIADFRRAIDTQRMASRTDLGERLSAGGRHVRRRSIALGSGQRSIVVTRNGDMRERRYVSLNLFEAQRIQLLLPPLSVCADRPGKREQDDRKGYKDAEYQTE